MVSWGRRSSASLHRTKMETSGTWVSTPRRTRTVRSIRLRVGLRASKLPRRRLGTPGYAQGYAPPPINWNDRGRVYKVGQKTCVPVGCYEDVLVIEEFERNIPGAYQLKLYAPGVGDIEVGWRGPKEEEKERLELVKDVRLSPQGLATARANALKLEEHAYEIKDFYGKTQPAKPTL